LISIITLDGPSGCGKGTISQLLATHLSYSLLDSGAIYRVVAYQAQNLSYDLNASDLLVGMIADLDLCFMPADQANQPARVILGGHDVTPAIRSNVVASLASKVAKDPLVRAALLPLQRSFAKPPGLVADGRDMGTVVFTQAQHKFYLDASVATRAQRRYMQLKSQGFCGKLREIEADIAQRDHSDRTRAHSPLKVADTAVVVDTSCMTIDEVLQHILTLIS
jgi:CMP/dCMP kinase